MNITDTHNRYLKLSFGSSRMYIKDARPLFHLSLVGFGLTTQIYLSQYKTLVIIVS